ncbi:hypothetical protein ADUPG1_002761, partial [Aduncisulcus paluster]
VNVVVSKVGTKTAKCLFDTGANVSLISEEWIARSGYRVDGDDSKVIAARRVNRFDGALVKADSPLTFTVFGGGKFSVTHYIVLKTCACRGSGTKYNQLTTSCGYVTYWVTPWLKNDVPLLIGRDGMSAMKIKLGIVDGRGYRERGVQNSEIKSVLRRLVDCVKPNREEKSVQDTVKRAVSETKEKDEESESDDVKPSKFGFPDIADMKDLCHRGIPLPKPGEKRDRVSVSKPSVSVPEKVVWSSAKKPSVEDLVN